MITNKKKSSFDVINEILSVDGIFEKVFGKLLNYLVFDESIDDNMAILKNIYGYKNVDEIFTRKVDKNSFDRLATIIFKFKEQTNFEERGQ